MNIEIVKCHGSSNDFVLIDEMNKDYQFTEKERVEIAKSLCDRNGHLGADGILYVENSDIADARMRMFNPDGSEAEMCGNGLRCVGRYVIEQLSKEEIVVETKEANLSVVQKEDIFQNIPSFEVAIEPVSLEADSLPLNSDHHHHMNETIESFSDRLKFTGISVPNPHLIAMVDRIDDAELLDVGKKANEDKSLLPNGVNISFVEILEKQKIFVRTYERGVGLTNACGTAMSASSLTTVLLEWNEINEEIMVFNKGGFVICVVTKVDEEYFIKLRGNATYEFKTTIALNKENYNFNEISEREHFEAEEEAYAQLQEFAQKEIKSAHQ